MWDRVLFPLRRRTPDIGRLLGSWRLSVLLMVVTAFYYLLLVVWAALSPPDIVQRIALLTPFWAVYALLLTNTGVCLWRRLPALRRNLRAEPTLLASPANIEVPSSSEIDEVEAERTMRGLGYRHTKTVDGSLWGVRQRWAPLGTFLFHGSFFVLAIGMALTLLARDEERIWVAVGEEFVGRPDQVLGRSRPGAVLINQPPPRFVVESITPEFWGDVLLFTRLESAIVFPGGERAVTRINRPLWRGWWTFLRLSGFGYAPRFELTSRNGQVLESAFLKLNVFPPGRSDYFSPDAYPHRVEVEVLPDADVEDGTVVNRGYELRAPAVRVRVSRGKLSLGGAVLLEGGEFDFEGLSLSFPEIEYWGEFAIVRDPGAPALMAAFLVAIAGLLLKVRGGRSEILWTPGTDDRPGRFRLWGRSAHLPELSGESWESR